MNTFTTRRTWKECTTEAEVFQECLLDIRDGLWICGNLSQNNTECTHVEKPMGCALGLVGINTGTCQFELKRDPYHNYVIEERWKTENIGEWDPLAQMCITTLVKALVTMDGKQRDDYIHDHDLYHYVADPIGEGKPYNLSEVYRFIDENGTDDAAEAVVDYNDGSIGREEATAWFQKALELAQTGR